MRLFTAIELPDDVRNHIEGTARRGVVTVYGDESAPLVRRENLHITLTFLGEIADPDVPAVCKSMAAIEPIGDVLLWVDHFQCFPLRGPVRVVTLGLGGDVDRLHYLHSSIERACEKLGYRKETRPYTPHVTVLRARKPLLALLRCTLSNHTASMFPGPRFLATTFALMQSDLRPTGPVYTRVASFPLSAAS